MKLIVFSILVLVPRLSFAADLVCECRAAGGSPVNLELVIKNLSTDKETVLDTFENKFWAVGRGRNEERCEAAKAKQPACSQAKFDGSYACKCEASGPNNVNRLLVAINLETSKKTPLASFENTVSVVGSETNEKMCGDALQHQPVCNPQAR